MILCIDPNLRGCGCALFDEHGELMSASYVKNHDDKGRGYAAHVNVAYQVLSFCKDRAVDVAYIEFPRVYPGEKHIDLNDLLDVAGVGAAVSAALCKPGQVRYLTHVFPSQWKGNVQKSIMLRRIQNRLTPEESKRCGWTNKSDNEDMLDAIGIGLWHFKRLNKRTYPGAS